MTAPVTASERDLRALARIVSQDRPDLPADGGLPESLLADLMSQIRCDAVVFLGFDSGRQAHWLCSKSRPPSGRRTWTGRTGSITGIASSTATPSHRRPA